MLLAGVANSDTELEHEVHTTCYLMTLMVHSAIAERSSRERMIHVMSFKDRPSLKAFNTEVANTMSGNVSRSFEMVIPPISLLGESESHLLQQLLTDKDAQNSFRRFDLTREAMLMVTIPGLITCAFTVDLTEEFWCGKPPIRGVQLYTHASAEVDGVFSVQGRCCACCSRDIVGHRKLCARCLRVAYCSGKCKTKHWPTHKRICSTLPSLGTLMHQK